MKTGSLVAAIGAALLFIPNHQGPPPAICGPGQAGCCQECPCDPCPCEVGVQTAMERLQASSVLLRIGRAHASGVLVQGQGQVYILTVAHLTVHAEREDGTFESIEVVLQNGSTVEGEVVANNPTLDVAILRTRLTVGQVVTSVFYNGRQSRVGDQTIHVGNPGPFHWTVTTGIVSHVGRRVDGSIYDQTSSSADRGSSGGIVATSDGRILGLVCQGQPPSFILYVPAWRIRSWATGEGYGFLLP